MHDTQVILDQTDEVSTGLKGNRPLGEEMNGLQEKLEDLVESVKRLEKDLLQKTDTLLFLTANTYIRNAMVCLPPMVMH